MRNLESFLSSVSVLDTETTNLHPEQAEIVEVAEAHWLSGAWSTQGMLLGAVDGIPPAASAKNNISNRMISGLPTFAERQDEIRTLLCWPTRRFYVAHNANYDRQVLIAAWSKCGTEADLAACKDDTKWLCTWRLSRHILAHDFSDMEYGLNYLRYKLDLPVADNLRLHRAADDTYLCAILLEHLVKLAVEKGLVELDYDIGTQLNELCWNPIIQSVWPFGKHKGTLLTDIPNDYYSWAFKNVDSLKEGSAGYDMDLAESVRQVLEARLLAP
jgi:DNA polymerase III epsilon subunit-like protein